MSYLILPEKGRMRVMGIPEGEREGKEQSLFKEITAENFKI